MTKYKIKTNKKFGFKAVTPLPSYKDINKFYEEEFYSSEYKYFNNSEKEVQLADLDNNIFWWDHIWDILKENFESKSKKISSVVDIGCGWGLMLTHFVKDKNVYGFGLDPAAKAVEYLQEQGVDALVSGLENLDRIEKKFDVVLLNNVLEHLRDPIAVLHQINQHLHESGGALVIDVPNDFNVLQQAAQKAYDLKPWWIAPPAHLHYFSLDSLKNILTECGYEIFYYESSFPMEMFLLFGQNYIENADLGRDLHKMRINFEQNLLNNGHSNTLFDLYKVLAKNGLGRQIRVYATRKQ